MGFGGFGKGRLRRAALAMMTTVSLVAISAAALAQSQAPSASHSRIKVSVPEGSLEKGLLLLGRQTGLRLLYPSALTAGRTTQGVSGEMDPTEAVAELLAKTGLEAFFTSENTVRIFDSATRSARAQEAPLSTITVEGDAASAPGRENVTGPVDGLVATQTATGAKASTPIVEVPQSISVVPAAQVTAQGAQTIRDALRYTPGVNTDTLGTGDFSDTFMRVRGFKPDLYLDGTRLPNPPASSAYPEVEPYNLERIEVLRGPSSALYGSSGPGGLVNMTSKRPLDSPLHEIALQTGSFNRKQIQFDFSDRLNGSPDALFRVVGLFRDADHQVDFYQDKREFIAPSLTLKNDTTKLTLLSSYFHSEGTWNFFNFMPASGTVLPNPNGRISMHRNYGEPAYDNLKREQFTAGYEFEHKFDDALTFKQNVRYMRTDFAQSAIAPGRAGSNPALNNDPRTGLLIGDPTMQNVRRGAIYLASDNENFTIDNQIEGKFNTGPFAHTLVVGFDYRKLDSNYDYILGGARPTLNIFNPVYGAPISFVALPLQRDDYTLEQSGIYFQDQIKLNNWILTVGGRNDWATTLTDNKLDPTKGFTGPRDTAFTGRAGLGYEFANGVVPYVSYATSFDPVVGASAARKPFQPTTGDQWEVGVKYQPQGTRTLITAAAFDITQQNVLTRDPLNIGFSVQTGEVNVKGFEFEARTEVMPKLNIIAAYTYLDAEITKSNVPGEAGHRPNFTPEHQVALWAQYGFSGPYLDGLTIGAGVRYVGETTGFQPGANYGGTVGVVAPFTLTTPDYALVDAMMSYDLGYLSQSLNGAMLRVNATNLFDKYYVAGCSSVIQCGLGSSRRVLATLSYKW
jgi:iron complex outermembrane receptor protein